MKLKTNLHFHTAEDPHDGVEYTLKEGINHAADLGFDVLAVTCHQYVAWSEEAAEHAEKKGILLISGIELSLNEEHPNDAHKKKPKGKHVVLLNVDKSAEKVRTFKQLEEYKKSHSGTFAIAAHPYFLRPICLGKYLEKYIYLMDAIEHSWYYSRTVNFNKKAEKMAEKYGLPFIATSDTHFLDDGHMDRNYAVVDAEEKTTPAVIKALIEKKIENVTSPSKLLKHMIWMQMIKFADEENLQMKRKKQ